MTNRLKKWAALTLTIMATAFMFLPARADDVASVKIDNTTISPKSLELYLTSNIKDAVTKENITVSLGGTKLKVSSVDAFNKSGEGITYLFLVDESGSIKLQMDNVKSFVKGVVSSMGAADKAAIVTVANTTSQGAFTGDKAALITQADTLAVTTQDTNLYRGITTCIDMFATYQSQITARKALIILSDGDEDFSSGITKDEVLTKIAGARLPIFTYALLPASPSSDQIASSKVFGSFARGSAGGVDFTNSQAQDSISSALLSTLQNSYAVKAEIDSSAFVGKNLYLEAGINVNGLTVKDGYNLQVSVLNTAISAPDSSSAAGSSSKDDSGNSGDGEKESKTTVVQTLLKPQVLYPTIGAVVLIVALVILFIFLRGKKKKAQLAAQAEAALKAQSEITGEPPIQGMVTDTAADTPAGTAPIGTTIGLKDSGYIDSESNEPLTFPGDIGATVALLEEPIKPSLSIRLVNISTNAHDIYERTLNDTLIIGRDPQRSHLTFTADAMMSGRHCQLTYTGHSVMLSDLGSTNGTFVNGVPITGSYPLERDDVISIGSTELRIVFENGK